MQDDMKKAEKTERKKLKATMWKTVAVFGIFVVVSMLLEGFITWMLAKLNAERSTGLLMDHIETVLTANKEDEQNQTEQLKENYISYAQTIAYIISARPELVDDTDELNKIAEFQHVDEIHIFDETGTIVAGTVPAYYGYSFDSGEQMAYFKPMLSDKTLTMCQDVTPNTAEGKSMMYAIVWNEAGTMMVEVGIEPLRLLAALNEDTIENVIAGIPLGDGFSLYAVDRESFAVTASTNQDLTFSSVPAALQKALGSKGSGTGSGLVFHKGIFYYCNYRVISGYIIAVVYSMRASLSRVLVPTLIMGVFLTLAGLLVLNLVQKSFRSETELKEMVRRHEEDENIIRAAGHGIWRFHLDETGHPVALEADEQWARIFGAEGREMTNEERLRYLLDGLADEKDDPTQYSYLELPPDMVVNFTFAWKHPEKGIIYVESAGTRHVLADGEVQASGYVADVTEQVNARKKWESEIVEAREKAESANAAKTTFLFNMSHDIRTPMNAIMGFRDLLEKHQDDPVKRAEYLKKIEDSSRILLSIINNVLEMARIEKGTMAIEETAINAEMLSDGIHSVFEEMMRNKDLRFTTEMDVEHPYMFCDPVKMREIFINILSNACKYTPAGGSVDLRVEELPYDREGWTLYRTTITDTGIGMSEEFLPHVFEEFTREHNTTEAKVEGTGLGMPIVKRLVELLGGTITVESKQGEGTKFTVTIPHRIASKSDMTETAGAELDKRVFIGKRILLAEDNDLNAEIAEELLTEAGFTVERAEDGVIVCDMLAAAEDGYYDLILMDIQMPNRNGYEAARIIREMEDPLKAGIPILAMTANAFEEDKREALAAGMNGHIAKPVDVNKLFEMLAGLLG